jgi:hypothetical protein
VFLNTALLYGAPGIAGSYRVTSRFMPDTSFHVRGT